MSFQTICPKCGAPSNPSTGICPFCKAPFSSAKTSGTVTVNPTIAMIQSTFDEGHLPDALNLVTAYERENPKALEDLPTVILYLRILLESEGPLSKINSLISSALLKFPTDPTLHDFLDISRAKTFLNSHALDNALKTLETLAQRSPENYLMLFTTGAALQWEKKDSANAAKYLEKCVTLRPQFLRAWACLGAVYKTLGNQTLSTRAFQKCLTLETDPQMRNCFQTQIQSQT